MNLKQRVASLEARTKTLRDRETSSATSEKVACLVGLDLIDGTFFDLDKRRIAKMKNPPAPEPQLMFEIYRDAVAGGVIAEKRRSQCKAVVEAMLA